MNQREGESLPNGDAANLFIAEHQRFRVNAAELARSAGVLVGLIAQLDEERCIQQGDNFYFHREEEHMSLSLDEMFDGFGHSNVVFWHYFKDGQERFRNNLGVDTPNRLTLGINTDTLSAEQVRDYLTTSIKDLGMWDSIPDDQKSGYEDITFPAIGLSDDIETDLFVDRNGNYAKVLGLPRVIKDPRKQVDIEGYQVKNMQFVRAQMTPRDFVLMKTALSTMTQRVQESLRRLRLMGTHRNGKE